jgi:hypothetical protein
MSPASLSFRSANVPETTTPVSKGSEKDIFVTSPLSSPIDVLKDVRAYERDRQRVKKAAELVKARERKEKGTIAGRNTWGPWSDKAKTAVAKSVRTSWFGGEGVYESEHEKGENDLREVERPVTPFHVTSQKGILDGEVKLADLVTTRKPRKNKGEPTHHMCSSDTHYLLSFRRRFRSYTTTTTSHCARRVHHP